MSPFQVFAEWRAKRVQTGKNTVKYRIPALQGALHREILHVTQNPCDIMSVNMVGAIFPKDISICSVAQEIARQIDLFTREPYDARVTKTAITLLILVRLR